jgi:hypothetical protein
MTDEVTALQEQLALVLGIAVGAAMKHDDIELLRVYVELPYAIKLAEAESGGLIASLRQKYGKTEKA